MTKKDVLRQKILGSVLGQVPFDGWTEAAFAHGVEQAGVKRGEADLLFSRGIRDVIDLFGETTDAAMLKAIDNEPGFSRMKVREKIAFGVRARLEVLMPNREAMRRLVYWYAMPFHAPLGAKRLYKTV